MKQETRKKMYIILSISLVVAVIISIGYSVLSSTLTISYNSVQQTNVSWDVGFVIPSPNTVTPETISVNNNTTGISCGTATVSKTSISIADIKLSKPGDVCKYTFTIANTGDINAKLKTFTLTPPTINGTSTVQSCTLYSDTTDENLTERLCGKIRYRLCWNDSCANRYQAGQTTLTAGSTKLAVLKIYYDGNELTSTSTYQQGTVITLNWGQN